MARQARFVVTGYAQHVIVRGNNRDAIFHVDTDYHFYLEKLKQTCDKHHCDLHAYVLMTNHVHLLMTPHKEDSLPKALQMMGRYYVQYFNFSYQRTGTLFEGRYKSTVIDSEQYLLSCYRYIELNPVRAAMVEHPSDYPWSSYRINALGDEDRALLLVPHHQYWCLGNDAAKRQSAYRDLFKAQISEKTMTEIRESTNKSWVLGSDKFKMKIEKSTGRVAAPKQRGGDRKSKQFLKGNINRVALFDMTPLIEGDSGAIKS
jgi:putative transposase